MDSLGFPLSSLCSDSSSAWTKENSSGLVTLFLSSTFRTSVEICADISFLLSKLSGFSTRSRISLQRKNNSNIFKPFLWSLGLVTKVNADKCLVNVCHLFELKRRKHISALRGWPSSESNILLIVAKPWHMLVFPLPEEYKSWQ